MKKIWGIALSLVLLFGIPVPSALADGEPEAVLPGLESEQADDTYTDINDDIDTDVEGDGGEATILLGSALSETLDVAETEDTSAMTEEPDGEEPFDPYSVEVGPENDPDDPLYVRLQNEQSSQVSTISLFSTDAYDQFTTRALNNETLRKGIDVSNYQGTIDWSAVAADGVEFVIIRAAYRGLSTEGTLKTDSRFTENIEGAQAAGLKVGVYVFSQAITVEEAQEEAQLLMALVKDYSIDLPLAIDYEYPSSSGRLYNAGLSQREGTDICLAFCEAVESAGYDSMVYASYDMLQNHLYADELDRVWMAHYATQTTYPGGYEYWQCSSAGTISGISKNVDLDFWFEPTGDPAAIEDPSETTNPFTDVSEGNWFYEKVMQAYSTGIVTGMSDTTFSPNSTATRGQVVTMIYRMMGSPAVSGTTSFTDLTADWYQDAVTWASQNQVVSGYSDTQFGPGGNITREQLAAMLYRLSGSPATGGDLSAYTDADSVQTYAKDAMAWAVETGIVNGYEDKTLRPGATATRAEVCTMLMRYRAL